MEILIVPACDKPREIGALFSEYTKMLIDGDSTFREYLRIQNYDDELLHLDRKYGAPEGRLYLAYCGSEPAGCIGLRKIDDDSCEMKRLYVKPGFRGLGIGRLLAIRVIDDAREIGYRFVLLDTLPFLETAIHMYRELGFMETECYNNSPMSDSVYMRLEL